MNYNKEQLELAVNNSKTYKQVLEYFNYYPSSGRFITLKKYIKLWNIDTSHFNSHPKRKGDNRTYYKLPIEKLLVVNSTYNTSHLKDRLYKEKYKNRVCELCGQNEIWNGKNYH